MFALLGSPFTGYQVIEVDGNIKATVVAAVGTNEKLGDRIVELLNRFGIEDSPMPAEIIAQLGGPTSFPGA